MLKITDSDDAEILKLAHALGMDGDVTEDEVVSEVAAFTISVNAIKLGLSHNASAVEVAQAYSAVRNPVTLPIKTEIITEFYLEKKLFENLTVNVHPPFKPQEQTFDLNPLYTTDQVREALLDGTQTDLGLPSLRIHVASALIMRDFKPTSLVNLANFNFEDPKLDIEPPKAGVKKTLSELLALKDLPKYEKPTYDYRSALANMRDELDRIEDTSFEIKKTFGTNDINSYPSRRYEFIEPTEPDPFIIRTSRPGFEIEDWGTGKLTPIPLNDDRTGFGDEARNSDPIELGQYHTVDHHTALGEVLDRYRSRDIPNGADIAGKFLRFEGPTIEAIPGYETLIKFPDPEKARDAETVYLRLEDYLPDAAAPDDVASTNDGKGIDL